jgi:hypothetical protein
MDDIRARILRGVDKRIAHLEAELARNPRADYGIKHRLLEATYLKARIQQMTDEEPRPCPQT